MTNPSPEPSSEGPAAVNAKKLQKAKAPSKSTKLPRRNSKAEPSAGAVPGTKTAKVINLLRRADGASLQELRKATGWQAHSVRGFLSGTIKKKLGYRLSSVKRQNGDRAYRIAAQ